METPEWSEKTEEAKAIQAEHWGKVVRQVGRSRSMPCHGRLRNQWLRRPCDNQRMFTSSAAATVTLS